LRFDLAAPIEAVLTNAGGSEDDARAAAEMVAESRQKLASGDSEGAQGVLTEAVNKYPYALEPYEALYDFYKVSNPSEAEYYMKQLIALEPLPAYFAELARLQGQMGRLDEAGAIEGFLWGMRSEFEPDFAKELASDYLVTLSRVPNPSEMATVASQAIEEYGKNSRMVYQYIYSRILANDLDEARFAFDREATQVPVSDPMYPHFMQMRSVLMQQSPGGTEEEQS